MPRIHAPATNASATKGPEAGRDSNLAVPPGPARQQRGNKPLPGTAVIAGSKANKHAPASIRRGGQSPDGATR